MRKQQRLRFVVFAQEVFDQRCRSDGSSAQRGIGRKQCPHLLEGVATLAELARRPERQRHRKGQLEPLGVVAPVSKKA